MSTQNPFYAQKSPNSSAAISDTSSNLVPQEVENGPPELGPVKAQPLEKDKEGGKAEINPSETSSDTNSSLNSSGSDSREASLTSAHQQAEKSTTDSDRQFLSGNKIIPRRKRAGREGNQQNKSGKYKFRLLVSITFFTRWSSA